MILYQLRCPDGHEFDGWFSGSSAFDEQIENAEVICPVCGNTNISKALMAPNITPARRLKAARLSEETGKISAQIRQLRTQIEKNAENVGKNFAREARRIHYKETAGRGIYGEASMGEVKELYKEGIEIFPLPALPEEHN